MKKPMMARDVALAIAGAFDASVNDDQLGYAELLILRYLEERGPATAAPT